MPVPITMPQLSDTMSEGTLVKWRKKEGDKIKSSEVYAEVETDKATMEAEAFDAGTLAHIVAKEGDKVKVGDTLAWLAVGKENPADVKRDVQQGKVGTPKAVQSSAGGSSAPTLSRDAERSASAPQTTTKQAAQGGAVATLEAASSGEMHEPDDIGHGATREPATAIPPIRPAGDRASAGDGNGGDANGNGGNGRGGRIFASPLARRIAADKGIDLRQLKGSGPNGRIVQRDVLEFRPSGAGAAGGTRAALPPPIQSGQKQVVAMTKMRAAIAAALQKSKQTIPHYYETIDIDVEELTRARERINTRLEQEKVRLSIADFITKALASTLVRHPALNARFDAQKNEITRYGDVNLGIAVAIPDGLIVPILRGVNHMGLKEIRRRSADLIERARAQRLRREEQTEGTFTVSSLGTQGIREFSAIINPPEVGILAVGAAEKRAVVRDGQIVARTMLTVTLSCDHRAVDGATAAEFLQSLKAALEEPALMLL
jgi:pyruvate dehydrogenase E2 component (dihydrolipoamide acetyltransferase)